MLYDIILNWDFSILLAIQEHIKNDFFDVIMPWLSYIGEAGIIWFVIAVPMLLFKKTRLCGITVIISVTLVFLIGELTIKNLVCRTRPCRYPQYFSMYEMLIERPTSYSFPSGHTASSFAAAVSIFLHYKKLGIAALALAVLISFSRLYNFVHFTTDVIAGMLLGIAGALTVWAVMKHYELDKKIGSVQKKGD